MSTTALFVFMDGHRRRVALSPVRRPDGTYYTRLPDWALSDRVVGIDIVTTPEPAWRRVVAALVRLVSPEAEEYRPTT